MTPIVLVTGLSGAGKASILRALEDLGYEAVDNPPLTMVETLVTRRDRPLAIGLDARTRGFDAPKVLQVRDRLRQVPDIAFSMVFATAEPGVLQRRFTETRRRHPLAPEGRVMDGITAEIGIMQMLRAEADLVLDTSELPLPALRVAIGQRYGLTEGGGAGMTLALMSFAFPAGLPRDADMVFDARFLRNPHYDPILRRLTGMDADVAAFIEADPDFLAFFDALMAMLLLVLPRFVQEGKKYATIAVGCTGGRHRSVRIVERMAPLLRSAGAEAGGQGWRVTTLHRELTAAAATPIGAPTLAGYAAGDAPERASGKV